MIPRRFFPLLLTVLALLPASSCAPRRPESGGGAPAAGPDVYRGPRARIALNAFQDRTAHGDGLGPGMGEMLAEALRATGRFALAAEGDLLVTGAVTEFRPAADQAGKAASQSLVAVDVRLIDTRSGRIVAASSFEGCPGDAPAASDSAPLHPRFATWSKTPMERALRACIRKAVDFVVLQTPVTYFRHP